MCWYKIGNEIKIQNIVHPQSSSEIWLNNHRNRQYWQLIIILAKSILVGQELLTLPEHLSSPPAFSGARVTQSLVLYVCVVNGCLSFCTFSFDHFVVSSSSIYGFWLPLWYLQTLLRTYVTSRKSQIISIVSIISKLWVKQLNDKWDWCL